MRISFIAVMLALLVFVGASAGQGAKQPKGKGADKANPAKGSEERSTEVYAGKTFEQWRAEMKAADASKRTTAILAILNFGPEMAGRAVPDFIQRLQDRDVGTRAKACVALRYVYVNDAEQVKRMIDALATRIVPEYETQAIIRYEAAVTLRRWVKEAGPVTNRVLIGLRDSSAWEVRHVCASILWRIGADSKEGPNPVIVQGFLDWLRNEHSYHVKLEILQGLGAMGKPANKVVQSRLVSDLTMFASEPRTNRKLAIWAYAALVSHGDVTVSKKALNRIASYLNNKELNAKDGEIKVQAALALGGLGTRAKNHVPDILKMLNDDRKNVLVVQAACMALHRMGDTSDTVVDTLLDLLKQTDPPHQAAAAVKALVDLKLNTPRVIGALDKMLENKTLNPGLYAWVQGALKELRSANKK
jgi:HEAT repeat protein